MAELKDSSRGQVDLEALQVKALEDELLTVRAHEIKLGEELQAFVSKIRDLESEIEALEGKIAKG